MLQQHRPLQLLLLMHLQQEACGYVGCAGPGKVDMGE